MKLNIIKTLGRFPELSVALALISSLVALSAAAEAPSSKGAARLLMKPEASQTAAVAKSMSCGMCRNVFVSQRDISARGANKPEILVAEHSYKNCSTTLQTAGQGKGKYNVALHQCLMAGAQASSCCGASHTDTASACSKSQQFQVAPLK